MPKQDDVINRYADMLDLPHHVSKTRARMPVSDRAAQFSPFAALTGHDAAIRETARLTDIQVQLDESRKELLNQKMQMLLEQGKTAPQTTITHFVDDVRKSGGTYVKTTGCVKKFDLIRGVVIMEDLTEIPVETIYDIN